MTDSEHDDLHFSVRKGGYVVVAAALLSSTATAVASGGDAVWAVVAALVLAIPGGISALRLCGPSSYALTSTGLSCGDGAVLAWEDLVGVSSLLARKPARGRASITVFTEDGRHVIPGRLSVPSRTVWVDLVRRITAAHRHRHAVAEGGAPYDDVPGPVQDVLDRARARGPAAEVHLFRGRVRKTARWVRQLPLISIGLALIACAAAFAHFGPATETVVVAVLAGVCVALVLVYALLAWQQTRQPEWLCLHTGGIAMVGKHLTGELGWEDIEEISARKSGPVQVSSGDAAGTSAVLLRTFDGARIPLLDFYDSPLPAIEQIGRQHFAASQRD